MRRAFLPLVLGVFATSVYACAAGSQEPAGATATEGTGGSSSITGTGGGATGTGGTQPEPEDDGAAEREAVPT